MWKNSTDSALQVSQGLGVNVVSRELEKFSGRTGRLGEEVNVSATARRGLVRKRGILACWSHSDVLSSPHPFCDLCLWVLGALAFKGSHLNLPSEDCSQAPEVVFAQTDRSAEGLGHQSGPLVNDRFMVEQESPASLPP